MSNLYHVYFTIIGFVIRKNQLPHHGTVVRGLAPHLYVAGSNPGPVLTTGVYASLTQKRADSGGVRCTLRAINWVHKVWSASAVELASSPYHVKKKSNVHNADCIFRIMLA